MSTEKVLANIEAILGEIERLQAELGFPAGEPGDREAYDIVCRIERRLLGGVGSPAGG